MRQLVPALDCGIARLALPDVVEHGRGLVVVAR
jgi:hypothetical protein